MTYNPSSRTARCTQRERSWDTGKELTFFFSLKKMILSSSLQNLLQLLYFLIPGSLETEILKSGRG